MNTEQKRFKKTMKKRSVLTRKKNKARMVEVMTMKLKKIGLHIKK